MNEEKIKRSIQIIRTAAEMSTQYYGKPLIITYSGGKDSDVLADLAVKSGANVEFLNSHTTVDAPETVRHIREKFKMLEAKGYRTTIHYPKDKDGNPVTMWNLIPKKRMPPTRIVRYCCAVLKESSTPNRYIATGVRSGESAKRSRRKEFEVRGKTFKEAKGYTLEHVQEVYSEAQEYDEVYDCQFITAAKKKANLICNPILSWTEYDIWTYIKDYGIKYNPLYDKGYWRVGCVGCPLGGRDHQLKEFADLPTYKRAYIRAFDKMVEKRKQDGMKCKWNNGQEVFNWWIGGSEDIPGQMTFL